MAFSHPQGLHWQAGDTSVQQHSGEGILHNTAHLIQNTLVPAVQHTLSQPLILPLFQTKTKKP